MSVIYIGVGKKFAVVISFICNGRSRDIDLINLFLFDVFSLQQSLGHIGGVDHVPALHGIPGLPESRQICNAVIYSLRTMFSVISNSSLFCYFKIICATCVFLAGKVEEQPKRLQDVVDRFFEIRAKKTKNKLIESVSSSGWVMPAIFVVI